MMQILIKVGIVVWAAFWVAIAAVFAVTCTTLIMTNDVDLWGFDFLDDMPWLVPALISGGITALALAFVPVWITFRKQKLGNPDHTPN